MLDFLWRLSQTAFFAFSAAFMPLPIAAMTFSHGVSPYSETAIIVIANGTIEAGDAARFEAAIGVSVHDVPALMITSPGGSVSEAMAVAEVLIAHDFTVIADNECASACAQIIFPAGEFSVLTRGSVLGIHSCSNAGARNDICNDIIAEYAVTNGFPYGTIQIFSEMYGPADMMWMTEISARCFGFYRGPDDPKPINGGRKACVDGAFYTSRDDVIAPIRPFGPSFDCAKASTSIENLFCLDKHLMQSDSVLGHVYDTALKIADNGKAKSIRARQRIWIDERNVACSPLFRGSMEYYDTRDVALCLFLHNEQRIYELIDNPYFK